MRKLTVLFAFILMLPLMARAQSKPWETIDQLEEKLSTTEAELRVVDSMLDVLREAAPSASNKELAKAREALKQAEQAEDKIHTDEGLDEVRDKLRAAQDARRDKAMELLTASETGKQTVARHQAIEKRIAELEARIDKLGAKEIEELARLRLEERHLGRLLYYTRRALWERAEVLPFYRKADGLYKSYGKARGKSNKLKEVQNQVKQARRALEKVKAELALDSPFAKATLARKASLIEQRDALKNQINAARKAMFDGAKQVSIMVEMPPRKGRRGQPDKPQKPKRLTLWIPPNCKYIRGVVVAAPQVSGFASNLHVREAAVREDLATMVMPNISFDGDESIERLDKLLAELAEKAGHPELKGAAVLTAGLSASVLQSRNVAYAAPDRVFGTVQIAGGNMHHRIKDPKETLSGVPFIAMNGEFEWCGPEGGIRPQYGRQTQWVMLREQLLRRWRSDHQHLMSLVVVPCADHGAWDARLAGLFVRKAAHYRLPKEKRDGSNPAKCVNVKAEDGWLSDADLDHPKHKPAPFAEYKGNKDNAFWHFDEEMAMAVYNYHKDKFLLADPTKKHPVPDNWPPGRNKSK